MQESVIPSRLDVYTMLKAKLQEMQEAGQIPDVITFAGNGEPTLHTEFEGIIDDTIELRNLYCPTAKVSVLSNSTRIHKPAVFCALKKVDNNILKFDSAFDQTLQIIDRPTGKHINVASLIEQLKRFEGKLIIQTMFLRGEYNGEEFDNTTDAEVNAWLKALEEIKPQQVMIYTIDRETPAHHLEKITEEELNAIAEKVEGHGYEVTVSI